MIKIYLMVIVFIGIDLFSIFSGRYIMEHNITYAAESVRSFDSQENDADKFNISRGSFNGYFKYVRGITYKEPVGYSANLSKLDVYYKEGIKNKPIIVFVHGGSWVGGDKSNVFKNEKFLSFFIENGFVLVSVNFRLPLSKESPGATYKDQANDIAEALKWVDNNIEQYGGNPDGVILVGYSSGAHLVSLLGTDKRYLARQGLNSDFIKAVVAMDVHAYDIPMALDLMVNTPLEEKITQIKTIFGESRSTQDEASPINFISKAGNTHFLIISAGIKDGTPQTVSKFVSKAFTDKLKKEGYHAIHTHFDKRSHVSLVMGFGQQNDGVSAVMKKFLDTIKNTLPFDSKPQVLERK